MEFEDGLWRTWPEMPGLVWWVMQKTVVAWNQRWWKFASCDENGRLRELSVLDN